MPHAPFVTRSELPRFGITREFLSQFDVRPLQLRVEVGGALGEAGFSWRVAGEEHWSAPQISDAGAPWSWSPDGAFADLSFGAGTYVAESTYLVTAGGVVSTSDGIATVTASRFDVVVDKIAAATARAVSLMRPRKEPDITSWGADVREAVAAMVRYRLKDYVGFAPLVVNAGDAQIVAENERAESFLARVGSGAEAPPDMTDSSPDGGGRGLMVPILSEDKAGF